MKTQHTSGKKIYFTVLASEKAGLSDQLAQLKILRKLGLSLGYDYLHTPLYETRRMDLMFFSPARLKQLPGPIGKLCGKILLAYQQHISKIPCRNIFYFLGLNQYFSARNQTVNQQPQIKKWTTEDFPLLPSYFKKEHIYTLGDLKRHIKKRISAKNDSAYPCLAKLSTGGYRKALKSILHSPKTLSPDPIDELDLRAIYFEHRRKHPRKSGFPRNGLKTLVHIRLGDRGSIKTPWDTWIYFAMTDTPRLWKECRDQSEFRQLTIADFHNFVQNLTSYFSDNAFAVLFSSDGFKRTFWKLNKVPPYKTAPEITLEKIKAIRKRRRHCERGFKMLKNTKNSSAIIGETLPNQFNFIHSILTADLIITAFPVQHSLIKSFLSVYFANSDRKPPIVILLHKPLSKEEKLYLSLKQEEFRNCGKHYIPVIPVDIANPDFAQIARRLNELRGENIPVRPKSPPA